MCGVSLTLDNVFLYLQGFWTVGTILAALLALATIPKAPEDLKDPKPPLGWHLYLGLCNIPLALVLPLFLVSVTCSLVYGPGLKSEFGSI